MKTIKTVTLKDGSKLDLYYSAALGAYVTIPESDDAEGEEAHWDRIANQREIFGWGAE